LQRPKREQNFHRVLGHVLQAEHQHVHGDEDFDGGYFHVWLRILPVIKAVRHESRIFDYDTVSNGDLDVSALSAAVDELRLFGADDSKTAERLREVKSFY